MTINQEQLSEIAETVWTSFLGMSLRRLEPSEVTASDHKHSASATVHISGSWNGSVILSCSNSLASRATSAMFEIGEDELEDGEIADAFGELANVIGGNLKSLLPEPSQLSLPTVSLGSWHVVTVPGAGLLEDVELDCDGDRLHIAVWTVRESQRREHHSQLERVSR